MMDLSNIRQVKILDNFEESKDVLETFLNNGWRKLIESEDKTIIGADWIESYNLEIKVTVERKHFGVSGPPGLPGAPFFEGSRPQRGVI